MILSLGEKNNNSSLKPEFKNVNTDEYEEK